MTSDYDVVAAFSDAKGRPQGRVLKGQYVGAYRSDKGKLKGLILKSAAEVYIIKLPKYLRPILVRELDPEMFVQVWAYPEQDRWRAINIMPLPEAESLALRQEWSELPEDITSKAESRALQEEWRDVATANDAAILPEAIASPTDSPKAEVCIQVCRKGKCFKRGSKEIWRALETETAKNPDLQHVSIEAVGCMKACKQGPNIRVLPKGKVLHHVNQNKALSTLSECQ